MIGPSTIDGVAATEFRYSGLDTGLSNYWTVEADGTVLFHGFDRPAESFAVHYVPALRFVRPPLTAGATWSDTVIAKCFRSPCAEDTVPLRIRWTSNGAASTTVPAGTFATVAIAQGLDDVSLASVWSAPYSLLGTRLPPRKAQTRSCCDYMRWWAVDVGLVQDSNWILRSFGSPTAARATRWGELKLRYR